jgi:hypothetical protein
MTQAANGFGSGPISSCITSVAWWAPSWAAEQASETSTVR